MLSGGEALPVELKWENGFLLQPEAIDPERTRILWINYPHNPTGATATYEYLESVVEFCREHDILLFSDECYNDIYSGDLRLPSWRSPRSGPSPSAPSPSAAA